MFNNFTASDSDEVLDNSYTNLPSLNMNSMSIQSNHQTSPISPDEMVIRSRGRRQFPSSFSPDRVTFTSPVFSRNFPSPMRSSSPPKPPKPGKKTRSSSRLAASTERVRKQLDYSFDDHKDFSILKLLPVIKKKNPRHIPSQPQASEIEFLSSHKVKKQKMTNTTGITPFPLQLAKGLSKSQLVDLLTSLTVANPALATSLAELLPKPDLSGLITNLCYLNQNIYKAIPVTHLSDRTDSLAYNRVTTHLAAFKKSLVEDLHMLLEAGQWASVLEYVILAWALGYCHGNSSVGQPNTHYLKDQLLRAHGLLRDQIRVIKLKDFLSESDRNKLIRCMTGFSVREVKLCKEKVLEGKK